MRQRRRSQRKNANGSNRVEVPVIDMFATGTNIVRLRELAGLSVMDLQERMGFASPQTIYRWQRGETIPSVDNLLILADVLGVTMDEIVVRKQTGN